MFKFKSYNVKKVNTKNEKEESKASSSIASASASSSSSSSSTGTLKKKEKKKASAEAIKQANNKESPEYSRKIYPKKTVTDWHKNKTYSAKNKVEKVVIPTPHKKLERQ